MRNGRRKQRILSCKEDGMGGTCRKHGRNEMHKTLVGKSEGKEPLGRPGSRWEGNINMILRN